MNKTIRTLKARKADALKRMQDRNALLVEENREATAEEAAAHKADMELLDRTNQQLATAERIERESQGLDTGGQVLEIPGAKEVTGGEPRLLEDPKFGFKSMGEFARVVRASSGGRVTDDRLRIIAAVPTTFGSEESGVDGGFLIPPEFSTNVFQLSLGDDAFLPYTDQNPVEGNSMVFPKDETTPWGADGIRAYWQAEAAAAVQTKPKLGTATLRLNKLMALVPVTEELLADTNALNGYIPKKAGISLRWKLNESILNGTGAGQPLGVNTAALGLTVSKDSGQATATVSVANLTNMVARLPPGSFSSAVWLANNDVLGALFALNSGGFPYWLPFGGGQRSLGQSPYGALLGRPLLITQHANTFSSLGDIQLHDFQYYWTITKAAGVETATSMHLYFDAAAFAYRMMFRVDGQPKLAAQISPAKGSNKMSPFLQLQNR